MNAVQAKLEEYGPVLRFISLPSKEGKSGKLLAVFKNREDALKLTNELNRDESPEDDATRGTLDVVEGRTLHFFRKPSRFSKAA